MTNRYQGLIVTEPGRMRECIQAFLASIHEIERVEFASNQDETLTWLKSESFDFVLMDLDLPDHEIQNLIRKIKKLTVETKVLVLAENIVQRQLLSSDGADEVLIKGASAQQFMGSLLTVIPSDELRQKFEFCVDAEAKSQIAR